jgi:hypothetical protein
LRRQRTTAGAEGLRTTATGNTSGLMTDVVVSGPTTAGLRLRGLRWCFSRPLIVSGRPCNRRVGKLYLPGPARCFGCRHCHRLTYTSRKKSRREAHTTKGRNRERPTGGGAVSEAMLKARSREMLAQLARMKGEPAPRRGRRAQGRGAGAAGLPALPGWTESATLCLAVRDVRRRRDDRVSGDGLGADRAGRPTAGTAGR